MKPVYLITGKPGTGKTSLIKEAVAELEARAGGFYTEEIRTQGTRLGFKLVTLDGRTITLAHVDFDKRFRVSKYGVDVEEMDRVGVPALREASKKGDLVVIDEIGKMELFSDNFKQTVLEIIDSGKRVLGTIMQQPDSWADNIKRRPEVNLVTITRANYQPIKDDLKDWLRAGSSSAA